MKYFFGSQNCRAVKIIGFLFRYRDFGYSLPIPNIQTKKTVERLHPEKKIAS
jgi:hypothetical protein